MVRFRVNKHTDIHKERKQEVAYDQCIPTKTFNVDTTRLKNFEQK